MYAMRRVLVAELFVLVAVLFTIAAAAFSPLAAQEPAAPQPKYAAQEEAKQAEQPPIDFNRAQMLRQKRNRGEKLTPEEEMAMMKEAWAMYSGHSCPRYERRWRTRWRTGSSRA